MQTSGVEDLYVHLLLLWKNMLLSNSKSHLSDKIKIVLIKSINHLIDALKENYKDSFIHSSTFFW